MSIFLQPVIVFTALPLLKRKLQSSALITSSELEENLKSVVILNSLFSFLLLYNGCFHFLSKCTSEKRSLAPFPKLPKLLLNCCDQEVILALEKFQALPRLLLQMFKC